MTTSSLLDILQSTDMLEINGLHAWEFVLAPQALVAAHAALAAGQGGEARGSGGCGDEAAPADHRITLPQSSSK